MAIRTQRTPKRETCRTCRYFGVLPEWAQMASMPDIGTMGTCQRYPPSMCYDDALNGEFPVVHSSMWCGEHTDVAFNDNIKQPEPL